MAPARGNSSNAPRRSSRSLSTASSPFATSEPKSKPVRGKSKLAQSVVPDSDESEEDVIRVITPAKKSTSFQGVYVPAPNAPPQKPQTSSNSSGPSSIADSEGSDDTNTPDTSTMNTPAVAVPKISATARALELRMNAGNLGTRSTSRKRKADDDFDVQDADAKLAARLQAEEYANTDTMSVDTESEYDPRNKRRRRGSSDDPVDMDSDEDDDKPIALSRRPAAIPSSLRQPAAPASDTSSLLSIRSSVESTFLSDGTATTASSDIGDQDDQTSTLPSAPKRRALGRRRPWT